MQVFPSTVATSLSPTRTRGITLTSLDFAGFYTSNWSDVAGYCSALAGSAVVGEELAQEAFARLYARWSLVQEPRPYVFRIASNLARSTARKARREQPTEHLPEQ